MGMAITLIPSLGSSSAFSPRAPFRDHHSPWVLGWGAEPPESTAGGFSHTPASLVVPGTVTGEVRWPWALTQPPRTDTLTNTSLQEFGGLRTSSTSTANRAPVEAGLALPSAVTVFGRKKSYFSCVSAGRGIFIVEEGKSSPGLIFSHKKKRRGERVRTE